MSNVAAQVGLSQDIIFDDTLTALPEAQVVRPTLDKLIPLDSGEYTLKVRVQLIPKKLLDGGLDNPVLYRRYGAAEAGREVSVF